MKSKSYWEQRERDISRLLNPEARLKKMYRESYRNQKKEIMWLYEAAKNLKPDECLSRTELYQFSHFLKMKKAIKAECKTNLARLNKEVIDTLTEAYKKTFKNKKRAFGKNSKDTEADIKSLESCLKTKWSGEHFTTRNVKNYKRLAATVESAIEDCIVNGYLQKQCIDRVMYRNNVSCNQAARLIQTEMCYVINKANLDVYKDEGCEEVEILAEINKSRCCDLCRKKDGTRVKIKEAKFGVNIPPFHPNCHCDILPVVKSKTERK